MQAGQPAFPRADNGPNRAAGGVVQCRMHLLRHRRFVTAFVLVGIASAVFAQTAQENAADADWLVKTLEIHEGSVVGEIGAGGGELTIAMAKAVGESGKVFSNELNKDRLAALSGVAEKAGAKNVTPIEGAEAATNFPDQCCDAIFMRNVYHHFADPAAMDASLFKSLKPGGRLAVIDFTPPGEEAAKPSGRSADGFHGVKPATVARELLAVGFEVISAEAHNRTVTVVARRPQ
jgi:ubiquinone/menaquinone biosynthesis C-methylase UbiE